LEKSLLMIPGPTPVPDEVLRELARPMINHRSSEYVALQSELVDGLRQAFQTTGDVQVFPASGTGGLEAAVVNVLSPGDRVVAAPVGAFGDRFAEIAEVFGASVRRIETRWGSCVTPEVVASVLEDEPEARALLLTQNETSTGVLNDIQQLAASARAVRPDILILVDAISGMLAADLPVDQWELDVVVAGSQKAWMVPPGLTLVSISARAWEAHATARMPRFYFDFGRMRKSMATGQTPYTPALPQLFALRAALRLIQREGLAACFARHDRLARATRAGVEAMGMRLFADRGCVSPAVTAVVPPLHLSAPELRRHVNHRHGVVLAGGQGRYQDQIFRIGHLGYVSEAEVIATLAALERGLLELGGQVTLGSAVAAAQAELLRPSGAASRSAGAGAEATRG
jgi:aspartate aminotransferase-like enzyme